jgi:site-specific recombinase XerD
MKTEADFPRLLETYFTERLMRQRQASPHTIASYRDTFSLLLRFAQHRLNKSPSTLRLEDLNASFLSAFLDYLEQERSNSANTRNARLAAIHSFFHYTALYVPQHSALIQQVLAIPYKKVEQSDIAFLTRPESEALLEAPSLETWSGRRDRALLLVAIQTGLRVAELTGLRCQDVVLGTGAHVYCSGKGRKERCTPLRQESEVALQAWLQERQGSPADPVFPNARGGRLSRDGVAYLLAKHVATARQGCDSLQHKHVTPHVLRHTAAMELLQHGVDRAVIALWLGHEGVETTQRYFHASLELKEQALAKITPFDVVPSRYRPDDQLLAFLKGL